MLTGCKSKEVQYKEKDKAPDALIDTSENINTILKKVQELEILENDADYEILKSEINKEKEKEEDENKTIIKMEDSKKEETKTNDEKPSKDGEEITKEEKQLDIWEEIDKKIQKVHESWNAYQPEGSKKSLNINLSNKFKNNIDLFTKAIESKNIDEIYDYGSKSLLDLSSIYGLYKDDIGGPINNIRYKTYQSYLQLKNNKRPQAISTIGETTEEINKIKLILEKDKDKIKLTEQLSFAIEDYKTSINEESLKLDNINKNIILELIEKILK